MSSRFSQSASHPNNIPDEIGSFLLSTPFILSPKVNNSCVAAHLAKNPSKERNPVRNKSIQLKEISASGFRCFAFFFFSQIHMPGSVECAMETCKKWQSQRMEKAKQKDKKKMRKRNVNAKSQYVHFIVNPCADI